MTTTHTIPTATHGESDAAPQNRNRDMQLLPETMARSHIERRLQEAEAERRGHRLARARRLQRRAERTALRARRALAMAVMQ